MDILLAVGSAIFAGATSILAKVGIKDVDSHLATALRTIIVFVFSWLMVFIVDSQGTLANISTQSFIFLILSGLVTGASWLCYFKALQLGDVNKVVPIDKSSTILTMILAFILLGERLTVAKIIGMIAISYGTALMIEKKVNIKSNKETDSELVIDKIDNYPQNKLNKGTKALIKEKSWLVYAVLSAVFASLTSILAKVGIEGVESNIGTAIRTSVVLVMAWIIVFATKKQGDIKKIDKKSMFFIMLSGIATGLSWICYYRALQIGQASVIVPIDKLSILVTVGFAYIFLKEKLSKRSTIGLALIVVGTLTLLI